MKIFAFQNKTYQLIFFVSSHTAKSQKDVVRKDIDQTPQKLKAQDYKYKVSSTKTGYECIQIIFIPASNRDIGKTKGEERGEILEEAGKCIQLHLVLHVTLSLQWL